MSPNNANTPPGGTGLVPAGKSSEYLEAYFQRNGELAGFELPMPFDEDTFLVGATVAGTSYREDIAEIYASLSLGDKVTLLRESGNAYDERAILIETQDGRAMGYVPRDYNLILSRLMDAGYYLYGKVRLLEICNDSYYHIVVKIFMRSL